MKQLMLLSLMRKHAKSWLIKFLEAIGKRGFGSFQDPKELYKIPFIGSVKVVESKKKNADGTPMYPPKNDMAGFKAIAANQYTNPAAQTQAAPVAPPPVAPTQASIPAPQPIPQPQAAVDQAWPGVPGQS